MLGYPDQARKQLVHMLSVLGEPIGAYAQAVGILNELEMYEFMRDKRRMFEAAERAVALARESGMTHQLGLGMLWLGMAMAAEGAVERGIEAVDKGRDILLNLGELALLDQFEHCAATAYLQAGKTEDGLVMVERLIEECAAGGMRFYEADLHRLKGELLLAAGAPMTDAEDSFRNALTIAQRQQAKSWELRASLSLARLLMKQDRDAEARTMLAEIYNWFTEGFDTLDLQEAKQLLNELDQES
jgi:predicted ATPase